MNESLITTITKHLLLREDDAGLSSDGLATNAVGTGKVAGLGVPPQGEPGGRRRRRKTDQRLLKALTPVGRQRFYSEQLAEGGNDKAVEINPVLPKDPVELSPHESTPKPKKRKLRFRDGGVVEIHPELPHRHFEDVMDEGNPRRGLTLTQADFWIRQGLFGPKAKDFINYWRQALVDPERSINNATYRPYVARALRDPLDLCIDDTMLNNRIRTILTKYKFRGDTDEIPESVDDSENNTRFRRWAESTSYYQERE
jgi:hypothetical protein